jgi:hypothetical protein
MELTNYGVNVGAAIDPIALEVDGKALYKKNDFLRKFANLMEHPEFSPLIKEYFSSWENVQLFMGFIKMYEKIGDQFPDFNGYQKISMVKSLIDNSATRQLVCNEVRRTFELTRSTDNSKHITSTLK